MATAEEIREYQLGQIQDTQNEQGLMLKKHETLLNEMLQDMTRMDNNQREGREQMIRLDEQVKGMREQNKSHHDTQTNLIKELSEGQNKLMASVGIMLSAVGIDPTDARSIEETRKDFFSVRDTRLTRKAGKDWFIKTMIGALTVAMLGLLYLGFINKLEKDSPHEMGQYQNGHQTTLPELRKR